jgi:glycolate oxidase FAD binding subunit
MSMPGGCRIPIFPGSDVPVPHLRPTDLDQLEAAIADAGADRCRLELLGNGTKRGLGKPVEADALLDLSRLHGVTLYEPEELVLTARAGTPLHEIEALLAQRGQMLAFEPMDLGPLYGAAPRQATIGGVVACNLAGPRRPKAGAARDWFLGFTAVSGRGERFKAGSRVMKNVTGYDLPKLLAGSHGTLAALAEVTLRVHPAPDETLTLALAGLDVDRAGQAMAVALGCAHEVSGAAYLPAQFTQLSAVERLAGASATLFRLEGIGASVAYRTQALEDLLRGMQVPVVRLEADVSARLWREVRDLEFLQSERDVVIWRLAVPPALGAQVAQRIQRQLSSARFYLDWGGGLVWVAAPTAPDAHAAAMRRAVHETGGHATLMRAPDDLRRLVSVFQPEAGPLAALSERVRAGFDPLGIHNPGRMG